VCGRGFAKCSGRAEGNCRRKQAIPPADKLELSARGGRRRGGGAAGGRSLRFQVAFLRTTRVRLGESMPKRISRAVLVGAADARFRRNPLISASGWSLFHGLSSRLVISTPMLSPAGVYSPPICAALRRPCSELRALLGPSYVSSPALAHASCMSFIAAVFIG
jgi:hypothetical protein